MSDKRIQPPEAALEGHSLYTTDELARQIQYHQETIRRLIREGKIHAIPFGRTYRISAEEVARILKEGLSD